MVPLFPLPSNSTSFSGGVVVVGARVVVGFGAGGGS